MSDHHDCEGLLSCAAHPRWKIIRLLLNSGGWAWCAFPPRRNLNYSATFHTHAEAIQFAQKEATK